MHQITAQVNSIDCSYIQTNKIKQVVIKWMLEFGNIFVVVEQIKIATFHINYFAIGDTFFGIIVTKHTPKSRLKSCLFD